MAKPRAFVGPLIHSTSVTNLEIIPSALLAIDSSGIITALLPDVDPASTSTILTSLNFRPSLVEVTHLGPGQFIMPGFVDTHNHAPQFGQRGLGQGMHIIDWLDKITFPNEARFADTTHARKVYSQCIDGFLRQGITMASYYASIHGPATKILADVCLEKGQRALVGKCNMTANSPDFYIEASAEESIRVTEDCIAHIRSIDPEGKLVNPVITPRFAISCTEETLRVLGDLAKQHPDMAIQTHFNEAEQEMSFTQKLFPQFDGSEADLYEHFGLLREKTILAHCCHMSEHELTKIKALNCGVAHCPVSNMTVGGGFMAASVREFLRREIKVGLGTDSGGGFSSSMLDAMRQAMIASHAREVFSGGKDKGLTVAEVFHLATLGGAEVCGLQDKIGNFAVGKEFDGLVIGTLGDNQGIMTPVEDGEDTLATIFEKFIMTGDDRNILEVYVRGRQVKGGLELGWGWPPTSIN
ncbi:hypothetical protein QBC35DRAFT_532389 [Podospora australis]|uniref:Guanine deaminase n=1 Tax=Podospora australis TaxID=1536484 RepID=A0AAN7AGB8_9PEZI|nr:hypothetical protein QBC35DRAFT_532389 [Podospora australis]